MQFSAEGRTCLQWRHGVIQKCLQRKAGVVNRIHSKLTGEVIFLAFLGVEKPFYKNATSTIKKGVLVSF